MDLLKLAAVTMLCSGVMNLTPWGGPTARAATALHVDPTEVFLPFIPAMVVALAGDPGVCLLARPARTPAAGPAGTADAWRPTLAARGGRQRWPEAPADALDQRAAHPDIDDDAGARAAADAGVVHARLRRGSAVELPRPGRTAPARDRARRQRAAGGVGDLRRRHLHRHPLQHRDGRGDEPELPGSAAGIAGAVP